MSNKKAVMKDDNVHLHHYLFSCKGYFGRLDYLGIVCVINFIIDGMLHLNIIIFNVMVYAVLFVMLASIQKRCRNMNIRGTIFISTFSVLLPIIFYFKYARINSIHFSDDKTVYIYLVLILFLSCHLILLIFPGKKEKNMELISPLLRHPYLYVGVCYMFYLIGFYVLFY